MKYSRNYPKMLALEQRIMFDGAFSGEVVDATSHHDAHDLEANQESDAKSQKEVRRIVFIDGNITSSNSLIENCDARTEVFKLNSHVDGIQQISDFMLGREGVESIHIISHGSEGRINIGNTILDSVNINTYYDELSKIGKSLSSDGDILLYGCNVAESTGREFISSLAKITGADVAASNNFTGSIEAGGDWLLEVESGEIEASTEFFSQNSNFSGLLTTPNVTSGGRTGYVSDSEPVVVSSAINITNGGDYGGGGSLTIAVTSADASETLSLIKATSASTSNNVVSVVGSSLYLGSGSGSNVIGSIDSTSNGANGNNLQINFLSNSFTNASFESGDLTGWTADTSTQIDIGTTSIAGIITPADGSDPVNSGGDSDVPTTKGTWTAPVNTVDKSHGTYSLQLKSAGMTTANGYDVVHGPSVYSDIFAGENGQTISFDWRALGGGDAYDVFGYIVNTDTNSTTEILNATGTSAAGTTAWATANVTIPATGNYRFVFISGTYDFTGGKAAGASLYIDNIQVFNAVDDTIVSQVARLITYETNNTTLTEADRAARTLTFTATDADGNSGNNTAIIFEDFPVEEVTPIQQVSIVNTVTEVNMPASEIKISRDGLQTFVRAKGTVVDSSGQIVSGLSLPGVSDIGDTESVAISRSGGLESQSPVSIQPSYSSNMILQSNSSTLNDGGLSVLNGIKDPEINSLGIISFSIPVDAFAKSNNDTMVTLKASQPDDKALPFWLKFDPVAGKFEGEVPEDFEGSIEVLVTATDQNGNEVTTSFVIEKDISSPGSNNDEQSELLPRNIDEKTMNTQNQLFERAGFSRQMLLSRLGEFPINGSAIYDSAYEQ